MGISKHFCPRHYFLYHFPSFLPFFLLSFIVMFVRLFVYLPPFISVSFYFVILIFLPALITQIVNRRYLSRLQKTLTLDRFLL